MEQKNFLAAIIISVVFLLVWYNVVIPRFAPPPPPATTNASTPEANVSGTATVLSAPNVTGGGPAALSVGVPLRNAHNDIEWVTQGAAVRHWTLKLKGQDIDLVESPNALPLPLSTFPNVNFTAHETDTAVTFQGDLGNGIHLTKTLTLSADGFLQNLTLRFKNTTSKPVQLRDWEIGWGPGIGAASAEQKENNRLIRTISMGPLHTHNLKPGEYEMEQWAAIDNRYFMVAFIPPPEAHPAVVVTGTKDQANLSLRDTTMIPAQATITLNYQLYAGPKGYTQLAHYGKRLEEGVDFGMFSPLGRLILSIIYRLQKLTGNYGWAIVILTIGLQLLLFPLTIKSLRAQLAMRKLQPQIAALQKQYKNDPKQLNVEMMTLYKKTGTNPFGGCLPMIIQLPIFWALFTALRNAYELRGAPFIGWIHDLSAPDPLHILPIVMGGAMFFQQRMTGAVTDPTQRQMMIVMPIMFTVMFFNFPSGLVLYWFTNNLITMLFQFMYQKNQGNLGKGTPDSPQIVRR